MEIFVHNHSFEPVLCAQNRELQRSVGQLSQTVPDRWSREKYVRASWPCKCVLAIVTEIGRRCDAVEERKKRNRVSHFPSHSPWKVSRTVYTQRRLSAPGVMLVRATLNQPRSTSFTSCASTMPLCTGTTRYKVATWK